MGFASQTGHRCTADVLDRRATAAECRFNATGFFNVPTRPIRVVERNRHFHFFHRQEVRLLHGHSSCTQVVR
jgi:hypothetical protein